MFEIVGCNPSEPMWTTTQPTGKTPTGSPGTESSHTPTLTIIGSTTEHFGMIHPPTPNFTAPPRGMICVRMCLV